MGHSLTTESLKPNPSKEETIWNKPKLCNVDYVQGFICFVKYLSSFLPELSDICEPFRRLTDKNTDWMFTNIYNDAVATIKYLIFAELF